MSTQTERATVQTLSTARLWLRAFRIEDAPTVACLAGRREIADTTAVIPHPYTEQHALEWIGAQLKSQPQAKERVWAITLKDTAQLIGAIGLREINPEHAHAELGYWIGVDSWRKGYATEAAKAVRDYAFETLGLNRVHAHYLARNPASGRVLEKIGMRREGLLRKAVRKWGIFEDVILMAILREEWNA